MYKIEASIIASACRKGYVFFLSARMFREACTERKNGSQRNKHTEEEGEELHIHRRRRKKTGVLQLCMPGEEKEMYQRDIMYRAEGVNNPKIPIHRAEREQLHLLPTRSKERGVLGIGSIPVAIPPSCQDMKTIAL